MKMPTAFSHQQKTGDVIRRDTLIWLIISQLLVLLPFISSHPLWLVLLLAACLGWRGWALHRGILKTNAWFKYSALIIALAALYGSGYSRYSLDTMVAVVLLGFVFKSIETWSRRDALVLVFSGYFLTATHFVYSQTPWQTLYSLLTALALTACAISAHRIAADSTRRSLLAPLRVSASMFALSIPLALLLFFIVPRLPPLWVIPQQNQAKVGLSDTVTPGDIANLVKSPGVAFRVNFLGPQPPREQWYWRALVFQQFDGKSWTRGEPLPPVKIPDAFVARADYQYQLVLEPSGQRWVPTLDAPVAVTQGKVFFSQLRNLLASRAINSVTGFEVLSNTELPTLLTPGRREYQQSLQLPTQGNERLRRWAVEQRKKSASASDFVQTVLRHIQRNDFFYTLQPPRQTSASPLDEFWFDVRQGFCSHYASAFVYVMRSAGIPARMVGGYLGGKANEAEGYISVRQMDAHAWAEVWIDGQGWLRVDPTAAVAPERVRQDLAEQFADNADFLAQLSGRGSSFLPLQKLQLWLDSFEYQWQRWVVQFDEGSRMGLINRLLAGAKPLEKLLWLAAAFAAISLLWLLVLGVRRVDKKGSEAARCIQRLEKCLAKFELNREPGEPLAAFISRVQQVQPEKAEQLAEIGGLFYQLEYANLAPQQKQLLLRSLRTEVTKV